MNDGYTAERLAALTETEVERLRQLEAIGILHVRADGSYPEDSVERVTLAIYAEGAGVSDNELETFCREQPGILASLFDNRPSPGRALTFDEALAQLPDVASSGTLLEALIEMRRLAPGEAVTEEDVAAMQMGSDAVALGFPAEALVELLRVFVDSMDRIAEAEVRVFHNYVHEQNRVRGLVGEELLQATDAVSQPMLAMADPTLLYLHKRAMARAMRDDFVRHLTEDSRPLMRTPGEAPATVVFIDLSGFTPLTSAVGDTGAAEVLARFGSIVRACSTRWHGRIVKQIGDAFMLAFDSPKGALRFGIDVLGAVDAQTGFPAVHIGAHHGFVLYRDGDYVGNTVNLAARVAGASSPGQFLVTASVADGAPEDVILQEQPPLTLKGIEQPTTVFAVCS
jgi:adenylate cyclase